MRDRVEILKVCSIISMHPTPFIFSLSHMDLLPRILCLCSPLHEVPRFYFSFPYLLQQKIKLHYLCIIHQTWVFILRNDTLFMCVLNLPLKKVIEPKSKLFYIHLLSCIDLSSRDTKCPTHWPLLIPWVVSRSYNAPSAFSYLQSCTHTHCVHHMHTPTYDIQHHAIRAPTLDIQHIHLHLVYDTTHTPTPSVN